MHTPKFHLAPHILTHRAHTFCLSSLSNSSAQHTGHDKLDWLDTQLSSLCTLYKVMICKLTNLLEYKFISFDGTNRICVRKSIKTTKLVQASTIVCSSSAMACWNSTTRHARPTRSTRRTCQVVSRRDESSGIWAIVSTVSPFIPY